jgi:hypothetical protein
MEAGSVLELVVFKLSPGVTQAEFLESNEPVSSWIAGQPGFISRDLSYEAEGDRWVDVIWWETLEEAEAASQRALGSDTCAPMFAMIEMDDMLFLHAEAAIPRVERPVNRAEAQ